MAKETIYFNRTILVTQALGEVSASENITEVRIKVNKVLQRTNAEHQNESHSLLHRQLQFEDLLNRQSEDDDVFNDAEDGSGNRDGRNVQAFCCDRSVPHSMNWQTLQDDEEHVNRAMANEEYAADDDGALEPGSGEDTAEENQD